MLTTQQEKEFAKYLIAASEINFGLTKREVQTFAYQFAKKVQVKYPVEWDKHLSASDDWYYGFKHRHPELSLRTPQQISINRAKGFNRESVKLFYDNLESIYEGVKDEQIWNMDETGCPTVPTKVEKVIGKKGSKFVGQRSSAERGTTVTMA